MFTRIKKIYRILRRGGKMDEQNQTQQGGQSKSIEDELIGVQSQTQRGAEAHPEPHGKWKRGMLPGQKYIRICNLALPSGAVCGHSETVTLEEWQKCL